MFIFLLIGIERIIAQYTTTTCVPGQTVYVPQLTLCYNSPTLCPGNALPSNSYYHWGIITTTMGDVRFCTNYNVDNCTPNCIKCKSLATNQCLICAGGSTRTKITRTPTEVMSLLTESCPCVSGYSETSPQTANCIQCSTNCQSCSSSSVCTTCNNGYFLNGSQACSVCIAPCQTCQSASQCLSCVGTNIQLSGTSCQCNTGYYWNISSCSLCSTLCLTCLTNSNNCTSCAVGKYLSSNQCLSCDYKCETCSGNANNCLSCLSGLHRVLSSNQCICENGYYDSTTCMPCDPKCGTCQNSSTYCLTCSDVNAVLSNNSCQCNSGYYWSSTSCQLCQQLCSTCQTTSLICLTCADINSHLQGSTCICNDGYYQVGAQCLQCQNLCQTCSSSTICLTCRDVNSSLNGNTCSCNNGYYLQSNQCLQCQFPCQNCSTNSNICLTCADPNSTLSGTTCNCNNGYYKYQRTQCLQCQNLCQTCSAATICLTCRDINSSLNGNTCSCNNGYYLQSNQCLQCQFPCQNCSTNSNICLTCVDPNSALSGTTCTCNNGYYLSGTQCLQCQNLCQTCSTTTCLTCRDINSSLNGQNCSCNNGYYLQSNQCLECSFPCQNCSTNSNICLTCADPNSTLSGTTCICNEGYYLQSQQCFQCQFPCLTCTSDIICLTCQDINSHLFGTTCQCNNGYYLNGNQCTLCQHPCQNCQQSLLCLSCQNGYFLSGNQCLQCLSPCQTCLSLSVCLSCQNDLIVNVNGVIPLQDQYYYLENNQCLECMANCQVCSSQTQCIICIEVDNLYYKNGQCICKVGYYLQNNQCYDCLPQCTQCMSRNICLTCIKNAILDNQSLCQCQNGYFYKDNICQKCSRNCSKCEYNYDNCSECDAESNQVLRNGLCYCKIGYYKDENDICQECNQGTLKDCFTQKPTDQKFCDDGNQISRDGCSKNQIESNFQCFKLYNQLDVCFKLPPYCQQILQEDQCDLCYDGYFLEKNKCVQCSDICLTCFSKFQCLTCKYQFDTLTQQCSYCSQGYYFNGFQCQSLCGDGIKTVEEQCDDGNQIDNDGCNLFCEIVNGFECVSTNSLSYCDKLIYPVPKIEIVHEEIKSPDSMLIKISFQEQMRALEVEQDKDLFFYIENFDGLNYQVMVDTDIYDQKLVQINVKLQFKQSLLQQSKMIIKFNRKQFRTLKNITQQQTTFEIQLPLFHIISKTQKQVTEIQGQVKNIMVISTGTIVLVSVLFGGLQLLLDFIDLIQFLSYLSYINTQYPYNYQQFMSILQFGQLNQLINQLDIPYLNMFKSQLDQFSNSNHTEGYVPIKIQIDGYQPQILINIPSLLIVWLMLLLQYISSILIVKTLSKFQLNYSQLKQNTKIKLFSMKIKQSLIKQNSQNIKIFFYSSIYKSIMATSYDTFFFISLSLANFTLNYQSLKQFIDQSFTIFLIIIYFSVIYQACIKISCQKLNGFYYKQQIGSLIEGLIISNNSKYYHLYQILKKGMFMYCLVNLYQDALFQIIVLIFINGIDLIYLANYKVSPNNIDYFRLWSTQAQILIHQMIISILVIDDFLQILVPDQKEFVGWFLVGNIQLLMIKQLFIYLYIQRKLYMKLLEIFLKVINKILKGKKIKNGIKKIKHRNYLDKFPLQQLPF